MSTNERSELAQFQGNSDEKSKCETKFTLAEEKKKKEEEKKAKELAKFNKKKEDEGAISLFDL